MATKLDHIYGVGGQVGNLANRVTSLETNAAKKNEANTFTQWQNVPGLNLKTSGTESKFIALFNGDTRIGFIGKASSGTNNNITIASGSAEIELQPNSYVSVNNKKISNLANPTANTDAANKQYVDRANPYSRVVNHTTTLAANSVLEWAIGDAIEGQRLHSFIIKVAVSGVDYVFNCSGWIQSNQYKNMFPTFSFAKDNNFTETAKIKFWVEGNKVKMYSSVALSNCAIYHRKEVHA